MKIGFLGFGQMASALAAGIVKAGVVASGDIHTFNTQQTSKDKAGALGYVVSATAVDCASEVDVLFISVKPQVVANVLPIVVQSGAKPLLISIVAGLEMATIECYIGSTHRIVRVMPNTPCMVGSSAAGYSINQRCSADDIDVVEKLLNSVGLCIQVAEHLLHAVTAVSGSGPAYIYMAIDAMAEGGVKHGLTRQQAVLLAAQTVLGSAQMVLEHPSTHVMQLKDNVSSPGGTTIAATVALREAGMPRAFHRAVDACHARSIELAEMAKKK